MSEELSLELRALGDILREAWRSRSKDEQRSFAQSLGIDPEWLGGNVRADALAPSIQPAATTLQDAVSRAVAISERIAAVSGALEPAALVPRDMPPDGASRVLDELAPSFDRSLIDGTWWWSLKSDRRLSVLRSLPTAEWHQVLALAREVKTDALGIELRGVLAGGTARESTAPLAVRALAHEWAAMVAPALAPAAAALRQEASRKNALASFDYLLDEGFFGRASAMDALRAFAQHPHASDAIPLLPVSGIGGSGKSTLLARVLRPMLEEAFNSTLAPAVISIDFDRRCLLAGAELELSFEASRQLCLYFPQLEVSLSQLRERASRGRAQRGELLRSEPGARPESASRSGDEFVEEAGSLFRTTDIHVRPLLLVLDTFEEWQREQYVRGAPAAGLDRVLAWASRLRDVWQLQLKVVLSGRSPPPNYARFAVCAQPIVLNDLKRAEAVDMLRELGVPTVSRARQLARIAGGMPLALKLAARHYLHLPANRRAAFVRDTTLALRGVSAELRQGILYGRFLDHIGDEDAQKVAHPGLALRRVSAQLIREVLAEPCGLDPSKAEGLFTLLAKEVWLVEERWPFLVHRPELRKMMLKAMRNDERQAARLRQVHEAAARWYSTLADPTDEDRAEALYHRVALASAEELTSILSNVDLSVALNVAQSAGDLDDAVRVQLLAHLGQPLSARDAASLPPDRQVSWATQEATELVQAGQPARALTLWAKFGRHSRAAAWLPTAVFQAQKWDTGTDLLNVDYGSSSSLRYSYLMTLVLERRQPQLASDLRQRLNQHLLERLQASVGPPESFPEDAYFAAVLNGRSLADPSHLQLDAWTEDRRDATRYLRVMALLSQYTLPKRRQTAPKSLLSGVFRPTPAFLEHVSNQLKSAGLEPFAIQRYQEQLDAALRGGLKSAQVLGSWSEKFAQCVHDDLRPLLSTSGVFSGEDEKILTGLSSDDPEWRTPLRIALAECADTPGLNRELVELLQATLGNWIPIDLAPPTLLLACERNPRSAWRRAIEYVDRCGALPQFAAALARLGSQRLEQVLAAYLRWHELRRVIELPRRDERPSRLRSQTQLDATSSHALGQPGQWINVALEDEPRDTSLATGQWYTLVLDIDASQHAEAPPAGLFEGFLSPSQVDEVEVSIQLDSADFEIAHAVRSLNVPRSGRSRSKARFEISPLHDDASTLTATLNKDGNFLQSIVITIDMGDGRPARVEAAALGRSLSATAGLRPRDVGLSLAPDKGGYDCVVWGAVAARAHLPLQPAYLASAVDAMRRELVKVVMHQDANGTYVFQSGIDIAAYDRDFALTTMARAGALLFQRMFFGPAAGTDSKAVGGFLREQASDPAKRLKLQIVAESASIPWGLLYMGDASAGATLSWDLFLGMRHLIEQIPLQATLTMTDSVISSDQPRLAISVNVDSGIDTQLGVTFVAEQQAYWADAAASRKRIGVTSRTASADVIRALADVSNDDQIVYFYCHTEAAGLDDPGGPDASALVLTDSRITLADLNLDAPTTTLLRGKPLIFINACESAEMSPAFYEGFVPYFMAKGARGVIGPQSKAPALFAAEWAKRFFERFLEGATLGDAFLALRREFLEAHGNPLGLLYAIHCDGDTRIDPPLA